MIISHGDPTTFVTRPLSAALLALGLMCILVAALPHIRRKRNEVFVEED